MTFEGTDCRLADVGRLSDATGGKVRREFIPQFARRPIEPRKKYCYCYEPVGAAAQVNIVSIGTVATEIRSACVDNILATGVTATMFAPDGV